MNLKEFSKKIGRAQTTVSRAMNGHPEVKEATRQYILHEAERLGYAPNTRAKAMATGRSMTIGHIVPLPSNPDMVNPIFSDFLAGAGESCIRHGYEIVLAFAEHGKLDKAYRDLAAKGGVDGLIVHDPVLDDVRISILTEFGLPFVMHGRSHRVDLPYSWVDVNNMRAFERGTNFLIDLGHRRIALINGRAEADFAVRRQSGYEMALNAVGITVDDALIRSGPMTEEHGYSEARSLLRLPEPPTAILASSIFSAYGIRRAAEEAEVSIGRDLSIVVFDDDIGYLRNGGETPVFTALRSSIREAGARASEMLFRLIANPDAGPLTELMDAELIVGRSSGPLRH